MLKSLRLEEFSQLPFRRIEFEGAHPLVHEICLGLKVPGDSFDTLF
jgi:hypothetical protein